MSASLQKLYDEIANRTEANFVVMDHNGIPYLVKQNCDCKSW
jgi:hypothetical protein